MQEALQAALDLTSKQNQQEIDNEHFLLALLEQSEGLARPLLEKMGVVTATLMKALETQIAGRSRIQGGAQPFVGNDLRKFEFFNPAGYHRPNTSVMFSELRHIHSQCHLFKIIWRWRFAYDDATL